MKRFNLVMVFDLELENVLMVKRVKDPFKGKYNLPGGKLEGDEDSDIGAYRELFEETGISDQDITLIHSMDFTYYGLDETLEIYYGILKHEVELKEEIHPLEWINIHTDFSSDAFAGSGNLEHMKQIILNYHIRNSTY